MIYDLFLEPESAFVRPHEECHIGAAKEFSNEKGRSR